MNNMIGDNTIVTGVAFEGEVLGEIRFSDDDIPCAATPSDAQIWAALLDRHREQLDGYVRMQKSSMPLNPEAEKQKKSKEPLIARNILTPIFVAIFIAIMLWATQTDNLMNMIQISSTGRITIQLFFLLVLGGLILALWSPLLEKAKSRKRFILRHVVFLVSSFSLFFLAGFCFTSCW